MRKILIVSLLFVVSASFVCRAEGQSVDENIVTIQVEQDEQRRTKKFTEETKDTDSTLISKRVDDYVYYLSGCIDTIELKVYDGKSSLTSKKTVKHFEDGKQPVVTEKKEH